MVMSHIPGNIVAAPDLPNSPGVRIGDRRNINVADGEGSRRHERHKSDSEDDEDVYEGGHEVHDVVNTEERWFFRCRGDYLPESEPAVFCPFKSEMSPGSRRGPVSPSPEFRT